MHMLANSAPLLLEAESTWMLPVLRVWIPGTGLAGNREARAIADISGVTGDGPRDR